MTIAFVCGNGQSRKEIDLEALRQHGTIYACNAIYREFTPNVLVSTDQPIAQKIQETGYPLQNRFYTRKPITGLGALEIPQAYYSFSSGPVALGLAVDHGHQVIYLLGFDMGPTADGKFNNIYADTEFYKKSSSAPTFTGNWTRQIAKISRDNPNIKIFRVLGETTAKIAELDQIPNLVNIDVQTFKERINKLDDNIQKNQQ